MKREKEDDREREDGGKKKKEQEGEGEGERVDESEKEQRVIPRSRLSWYFLMVSAEKSDTISTFMHLKEQYTTLCRDAKDPFHAEGV